MSSFQSCQILIDGRQPVRPMAPAHSRFAVGYVWNIHAARPLGHGRPYRSRFAISLPGLLVGLPIAGSAVEFEQHAGTELGAVRLAEADLNAEVLLTRRKAASLRAGASLAAASSARVAAVAESSKNCATSMVS